jgi:hypothetical protein
MEWRVQAWGESILQWSSGVLGDAFGGVLAAAKEKPTALSRKA